MKKLTLSLIAFGALAMNAFGAGITVTKPIYAGATELKPGAYKFELKGETLQFKDGKTVVAEVPAVAETASAKFKDTMYESVDGKLTAIRVGGTTTRIVLK
jgi:hypothetical protein